MDRRDEKPYNLNTLLLGILLTVVPAISGWTLIKVVAIGESVAVGAVNDANQTISITELRARVAAVELQVHEVKLNMAVSTASANAGKTTVTTTTSIPKS